MAFEGVTLPCFALDKGALVKNNNKTKQNKTNRQKKTKKTRESTAGMEKMGNRWGI